MTLTRAGWLSISVLMVACRQTSAPPETRPVAGGQQVSGRLRFAPGSPELSRIRIGVVGEADFPDEEFVAPGKIEMNPNRVSNVLMPVPGRITAVHVQLGVSVEAGQPLVSIESPEAEEAMSDCMKADAARSQANALLLKAQADHERARDLFENGAVPKKEVLTAEAALAQAKSALMEAEASREQVRRRLTILGLSPCSFGQSVVVRSPMTGKIMSISVAPGEYRNDTNAPLMTVADLSRVWVVSEVPESSIRLIHNAEKIRIELSAYPGEVFFGQVTRIADTVDPATRVVRVQAELDNRHGRLRPEMFARIRHSHGSRKLPVAPAGAVLFGGNRSFVFVEGTPGEFERVEVTTGEARDGGVPILSGLRPGARVVVDGAILLRGL